MKIMMRCLMWVPLALLTGCESDRMPARSRGSGSSASAPVHRGARGGVSGVIATTRPPDAQLLYQSTASDAFGRTTHTGVIQQTGPVVEEVSIGNQPVYPGQPLIRPTVINGVVQPGYVPAGTSGVFDPTTGRVIPVRRR